MARIVTTHWAAHTVATKVTDSAYGGIAALLGKPGGDTTSEKLILTKSYVAPELIVSGLADRSQSRGKEIS